MRYLDMHKLARQGCHQVAPRAWHIVPVLTGDYDLDATIGHSRNKDMPARLAMYTGRSGYGPRTNYGPKYGPVMGDD
jgi:hypothetical protein